ncbi:hypothetical protein ABIA31_007895 [Catenulispora sp. MAP5-51]
MRGGVLAAVLAVLFAGPVVGFVWINATAGAKCSPAQAQAATDLYNLVSAPVTSKTTDSGPGTCEFGEANPGEQEAQFDGPITETALLAAYRQHASEVGWRERAEVAGSHFLSFDAALADGMPVTIDVWTDEKVVGGVIPSFTVQGNILGTFMNPDFDGNS